MKKDFLHLMMLLFLIGAFPDSLSAQVNKPVFHTFTYPDNSNVMGMSDNGLWSVAFSANADNSLYDANAKLIDLTSGKTIELLTDAEKATVMGCGAYDVTNNAIVVGNYDNKPAVYENGKWRTIPMPDGCTNGTIKSVTPDGHYAVGLCRKEIGGMDEISVLWDLTKDAILETPGILEKDMLNTISDESRFVSISADGKYILGCLSYAYVYPPQVCYYLYDRETKTSTPIAYNVNDEGKWSPLAENIYFISSACMSNNGKYVSGAAYVVNSKDGGTGDEYLASFIYNTQTKAFNLFNKDGDQDVGAFCVDNNGVIYASSPVENAVREVKIRSGNYWYNLKQILKQRYNTDYVAATGYDYTGCITGVNDAGNKVAAISMPKYGNFSLDLPETFGEATRNINLLSDYSIKPVAGSTFSKISNLSITFDRNVQIVGNANSAVLKDENGNILKNSISLKTTQATSQRVDIGFRTFTLDEGKKYTVSIPAGTIALADDATQTNKEINISYIGRKNMPVSCISSYPKEGASVRQIDYTDNPVILTFDTNVQLTDTASANLYDDESNSLLGKLNMVANGNKAIIYPTSTQYLYKDLKYHLTISKGSITDVVGNDGNDTIRINYIGAYEREAEYKDGVIFEDNFDTNILNKFILFDGDRLSPSQEMQDWGFTSNKAWNYASDDDNLTNLCAVSHSMYNPAGQSNDWMMTPQLYIPNKPSYLTWKSQSFKSGKNDKLKIIAWAYSGILNALSSEIVTQIEKEGEIIFDEQLSPGAQENVLAGDWSEHTISLNKYQGKNIYIAFVNQNNNQSCIFIDDIKAWYDSNFHISLTTPSNMVQKEETEIAGKVVITSLDKTFSSIKLSCLDKDGNSLSEINESGLSLKKGDTYNFTFKDKLPLQIGRSNHFTVKAELDGESEQIASEIKDLAFEPTKRVVLEEATGMWCGNCPLGILAIEHLEKLYNSQFIPICIHGGSDAFAFDNYVAYLGVNAYPSGMVNRSGTITYPMVSNTTEDGKKHYEFTQNDGTCWLDAVQNEFSTSTEADITMKASYDKESNTVSLPTTIRYAVDATDLKVSLLYVVLEDNLSGRQTNYFSAEQDENLGEWASGGIYATHTVSPYIYNDVARSIIGYTFNGTAGQVPSEVTAGTDYVINSSFELPKNVSDAANCKIVGILIDGVSGKIINANKISLVPSGIKDYQDEPIAVNVSEGKVIIKSESQLEIAIYSSDGKLLKQEFCIGDATLDINGYKGMAVVKIANAKGKIIKKVIL